MACPPGTLNLQTRRTQKTSVFPECAACRQGWFKAIRTPDPPLWLRRIARLLFHDLGQNKKAFINMFSSKVCKSKGDGSFVDRVKSSFVSFARIGKRGASLFWTVAAVFLTSKPEGNVLCLQLGNGLKILMMLDHDPSGLRIDLWSSDVRGLRQLGSSAYCVLREDIDSQIHKKV